MKDNVLVQICIILWVPSIYTYSIKGSIFRAIILTCIHFLMLTCLNICKTLMPEYKLTILYDGELQGECTCVYMCFLLNSEKVKVFFWTTHSFYKDNRERI